LNKLHQNNPVLAALSESGEYPYILGTGTHVLDCGNFTDDDTVIWDSHRVWNMGNHLLAVTQSNEQSSIDSALSEL